MFDGNENYKHTEGLIQRHLVNPSEEKYVADQPILLKIHPSHSTWHSMVCMFSMCLCTCLTTSGHAPNETTDGVLGHLLLDLDQGSSVSDELKHNVPDMSRRVLLDLGQASMGAGQYELLYLPQTVCKLLPHEVRHYCATGGNQDRLYQCSV